MPPRDFYLYFLPPYEEHRFKDEKRADEVFFRLADRDEEFDRALRRRAAASDLAARASGHAKNVYTDKAEGYLGDLSLWLRGHLATAYRVTHQGHARPFAQWMAGGGAVPGRTDTVRGMVNTVASGSLAAHFSEQAPDYPTFHDYQTAENRPQAVADALRWVAGSKKTLQAARVLDALELLDGERLDPGRSRYAKHILAELHKRGSGKVVNRAELIDTVQGVEFMAPDSFRLEPEWVVVVLAALAYGGHVVVATAGKRFDASGLPEMAGTAVADLTGFKHIEWPKEWNVPGLKALFELLDLPPGEAQQVTQGRVGPVRELQRRVEVRVEQLATAAHEVRAGINFWGEAVLSDNDAATMAEKLDDARTFLESVRPFNTPGKFKNFTYGSEQVRRRGAGLEDLSALRALMKIVRGDVGQMASYFQAAAAVLPGDHGWIVQATVAREEVLSSLQDRAAWGDHWFPREN